MLIAFSYVTILITFNIKYLVMEQQAFRSCEPITAILLCMHVGLNSGFLTSAKVPVSIREGNVHVFKNLHKAVKRVFFPEGLNYENFHKTHQDEVNSCDKEEGFESTSES